MVDYLRNGSVDFFHFCMQIDVDETNIFSKNQKDWVDISMDLEGFCITMATIVNFSEI